MKLPPFYMPDKDLPHTVRRSIAGMTVQEKALYLTEWLSSQSRRKPRYMLYLILYDIENNKIRTHIAKYLIKKGCLRIQKSVYLLKTKKSQITAIKNTLQEVNEAYDNKDSILVIPLPQEKFKSAKMIGKNVIFETVIAPKNVLIF